MKEKISKLWILAVKGWQFGLLQITSLYDGLLFRLRLPVPSPAFPAPGKRTIVYLGGNLPPRIARIVKWHKKTEDFQSILVCHRDGYRSKYGHPALDRVLLFRNKWHMLRILEGLGPVSLVHAFGPKSRYPAAARKALRVPFIYDMQDVLVVYYGLHPALRWYRHELPYERYCLSRADGFISHSLEFQEAVRRYGIGEKPRNLFFPLCCDDDVFTTKRGVFNPDEFHLVYVGEVAGSFRDARQFATIQFHNLARTFAEQTIHLHLYPAPGTFARDVQEYRDLAAQNRFLHVHEPVHQSALAGELSRYDFGLIPFFYKDTMHDWEKFKYSTSLKLFNYVEAGIPVIATKDIVFQSWIVERYGFGMAITREDLPRLKERVQRVDYKAMLEQIAKNRNKLALSRHMPRIVSFYNSFG